MSGIYTNIFLNIPSTTDPGKPSRDVGVLHFFHLRFMEAQNLRHDQTLISSFLDSSTLAGFLSSFVNYDRKG